MVNDAIVQAANEYAAAGHAVAEAERALTAYHRECRVEQRVPNTGRVMVLEEARDAAYAALTKARHALKASIR